MLIEELFSRGIMTMGVSKADPLRQVGVFRPEAVAELPAARAAAMGQFRWIAGEWSYENRVPATRLNPAYTEVGSTRFAFCERDSWVCTVSPDGKETHSITFDPFSRQWVYVLTQGSYGMLWSREGWVDSRIVFSGPMTMIGINCEWRMTWTKTSDDAFRFVNEECSANGAWDYIDEWCFERKARAQ
jgi:hypothetical protein